MIDDVINRLWSFVAITIIGIPMAIVGWIGFLYWIRK